MVVSVPLPRGTAQKILCSTDLFLLRMEPYSNPWQLSSAAGLLAAYEAYMFDNSYCSLFFFSLAQVRYHRGGPVMVGTARVGRAAANR